MTTYTEFDQKVLEAVRAGADHFCSIIAHGDVKERAQRIADQPGISRGGIVFGVHILERRLQALRRAGKIEYVEKSWKIVATAASPRLAPSRPST